MKIGCWFAEITGRDAHRASCPRCQARARFDAGIRRIAGPVEVHAADSGILGRAITAGLAARADGTVGIGRIHADHAWLSARWRRPALGIAFAAAAVAIVALWLARGSRSDAPGEVADAWIGAPLAQGVPIAVGHAEVIAADGALVMRSGASEIWLGRGQVEVEVDPEPQRSFAVRTPRFTVRVLGTHFVVSEAGVKVDRGVVQIVDTDEHVVLPRLAAGERWLVSQWASASAPATATEPTATQTASADSDLIEIDPAGSQTASRPKRDKPTAEPKRDKPPPAEPKLDTHARVVALQGDIAANRDVPAARSALEQLARTAKTRAERADAEEALGESYIRTGQPAEAQRRLSDVADRYRDVAFGEAALFAASKAARQAGHPADERALLDTYITRYPAGSLITGARKRLDAIAKGR
jgi:hypothetical protein